MGSPPTRRTIHPILHIPDCFCENQRDINIHLSPLIFIKTWYCRCNCRPILWSLPVDVHFFPVKKTWDNSCLAIALDSLNSSSFPQIFPIFRVLKTPWKLQGHRWWHRGGGEVGGRRGSGARRQTPPPRSGGSGLREDGGAALHHGCWAEKPGLKSVKNEMDIVGVYRLY